MLLLRSPQACTVQYVRCYHVASRPESGFDADTSEMSLNSQPRGGAKGISRNGRLTVEVWTQRREASVFSRFASLCRFSTTALRLPQEFDTGLAACTSHASNRVDKRYVDFPQMATLPRPPYRVKTTDKTTAGDTWDS